MNPAIPHGDDSRLDLYVDGLLNKAQREEFKSALRDHPELRRELEDQQLLDASLHRQFDRPWSADQERRLAVIMRRDRARRRRTRLPWAVAAAVVLAAGWLSYSAWWPQSPEQTPGEVQLVGVCLDSAYRKVSDPASLPAWKCEDRREFAQTFESSFGQALVADAPPDGTICGLSYVPSISDDTIALLVNVNANATRVVVFIDREQAAEPTVSSQSGLHLFSRIVGKVALYEVSPLSEAVMLERIHMPGRRSSTHTPPCTTQPIRLLRP